MTNIIDHSRHETSYERYTNQGQHAGIINNINQYDSLLILLAELERHCSPTAAFDSAARFDPPRCAESTRLGILQIIEEWMNRDGDGDMQSSLFWLHGGAGVGKSALAQSLSEKFKKEQRLGASFFFFRSDSSRNNGNNLIPTLVSHLINTFEEIIPLVADRIRKNRAVFTKRYQVQIQELLIEPLLALKSEGFLVTHPRLIVIDGLDECQDPDIQCELLRVIAHVIPQIPYPLRFFITSRPEAHITQVFSHDRDLQAITVHRYNLSDDPDADMDIRRFLEDEFLEISRVHRLREHLPHDWPDGKSIASLVERSSGHFIYASTVIRYIRSPRHRPDDRLEVILRLRPPQEGDKPYAQLDALYALIFQDVGSHSQLRRYVSFSAFCTFKLLEMKDGDLVLLLDPILSLVAIDGGGVRILHKSLFDYLLDSTRGGHLPFDPAQVHQSAAKYILKQWLVDKVYDMISFRDFAYHCQYACLDDALNDCLHSLEVTCPKSIVSLAKVSPWHDKLFEYLPSAIWYFFRTLSRKDFDSTRRVYEQYVAKWTSHLVVKVDGPKYFKFLNRKPDKPEEIANLTADNLKRELDTLLKEWKPLNFRTHVGTDPNRHVAFIKQEHIVFSACVKACLSAVSTHAIASSLVFGDRFIHSYSFGWDEKKMPVFLILHTYSRDGDTCYQHVFIGDLENVVRRTSNYLQRIEKYLFSDVYQKYGLLPEEDIPSV